MKMADAKQKLMELAKGGYHSMEYTVDDHGGGRVSQRCRVYLPDYGHFDGAHWESAISQLQDAMSGAPKISEELPVSKSEPSSSS